MIENQLRLYLLLKIFWQGIIVCTSSLPLQNCPRDSIPFNSTKIIKINLKLCAWKNCERIKKVLFIFISPHRQVAYLKFKRLWNFARETFAPVWSLIKPFMWKNLIIKPLQKIWSENTRKRRPRGSSVKSGPPSSAKCAFHKSFKYTSCICLKCKLYFFLVCVKGMTLK